MKCQMGLGLETPHSPFSSKKKWWSTWETISAASLGSTSSLKLWSPLQHQNFLTKELVCNFQSRWHFPWNRSRFLYMEDQTIKIVPGQPLQNTRAILRARPWAKVGPFICWTDQSKRCWKALWAVKYKLWKGVKSVPMCGKREAIILIHFLIFYNILFPFCLRPLYHFGSL